MRNRFVGDMVKDDKFGLGIVIESDQDSSSMMVKFKNGELKEIFEFITKFKNVSDDEKAQLLIDHEKNKVELQKKREAIEIKRVLEIEKINSGGIKICSKTGDEYDSDKYNCCFKYNNRKTQNVFDLVLTNALGV